MIEVSKLSIATYRLLIRNLGILLHIVYCMNRDAFRDFISEQFFGNNRSVGSVYRVGVVVFVGYLLAVGSVYSPDDDTGIMSRRFGADELPLMTAVLKRLFALVAIFLLKPPKPNIFI